MDKRAALRFFRKLLVRSKISFLESDHR